jgi:hypothetical protein
VEAASRWIERRWVQFRDSSWRTAWLTDGSSSTVTWEHGGASSVLARCGGPSGRGGSGVREG